MSKLSRLSLKITNFPLLGAVALIILWCVVRFVALESSPAGFYIDEAASALAIICRAEDGTNEAGQEYFLFTPALGGGFFTPAYLTFGMLWVKLFGYSIASFRAVAALFTVLTVVGIYFLARLYMARAGGIYAALCAALSPWSFQFSRIAWDPPLMPCFLVWGTYFLLRSSRLRDGLLSALLLALALYTYPPARVQVLLLLPVLIFLQCRRFKFSGAAIFTFLLSLSLGCIPLIVKTASGELQGRFEVVGILSEPYFRSIGLEYSLPNVISQFAKNFWLHFDVNFLLVSGDRNLRHSSGLFGELGWVDIWAVCGALVLVFAALLRRRPVAADGALLLAIAGIAAGFVPAALTWESIPHALRSIGAWPFISLLSGWLLMKTAQKWRLWSALTVIVALSYSFFFLIDYFAVYSRMSQPWFDASVKELALRSAESGEWNQFSRQGYDQAALRYYLIRYAGESCSGSKARLERERKR